MLGSVLIICGIVWFVNSGKSIQDLYTANKPKKATIISSSRDPNEPLFLGKQEIKDIHVESIKTKRISFSQKDELKTFINSMNTAKKAN